MNAISLLATIAALAGAPQASAEPSPSASPAASAPISTTASPAAAASPLATTAPEFYKYRFVPRQPDRPEAGKPQIFAVYLNDKTLHSLGPIQIKVTTGPDVVKVVSQSNGRAGIIPEIAPGDFEAFSTLPKVPFIAAGMTVYLEFVATGPSGAKTSVRVPVKIL